MKILQISASYKPAYIYGGPIMSVSMLAEQLVKTGVAVDIFTTTANGREELLVKAGIPIIIDRVAVTYFKRITKDHTHFSPALLLKVWREAKNYDIIHIHAWWNLVSVLSCLIAIMKNIPVVISPRGTLSNYSFHNKNSITKFLIHNIFTKPMVKKCFIHVTSAKENASVSKIVKSKEFFNIPNFIRFNVVKKYPEPNKTDYLKIIFFSRIEEKKGLDILLNALPNVKVPFKLSIAGDGDIDYINTLKNISKGNANEHHINWLGFQGENKFELLSQHDLMVLPSYDENFGNVVIESLSVGTAVLIGENVGLADYVINNEFGWTCLNTETSVADNINLITFNLSRLKQIRRNAPHKIYEDFNNENLSKKYLGMYNEIFKDEQL